MLYAKKNLEIAKKLGDCNLEIKSNLNISYAYSSTGQFSGALEVLFFIDKNNIPDDLKMEYFGHLCHIYARLAEYSDRRDSLRDFYYNREFIYADSVLNYMSPDDEYYLVYKGWRDQRYGNIPKLTNELEEYFSKDPIPSFPNSQILYLLACLYRGVDSDRYLYYLAKVAQMDIKIVNSDSRAFGDLANELHNRGNIADAYKYATFGMGLAIQKNNRVRMISMMEDLTGIQNEIVWRQQDTNKKLIISLWSIGGMSLLLILAIVFIVSQYRKMRIQKSNVSILNRKLNEANSNLNKSNETLIENVAKLTHMHSALKDAKSQVDVLNTQLSEANKSLSEQNAIKEEYIGFALLLCSDYISKLDEYRKNVRRMVNAGKYDNLKEYTATPLLMDQEVKEFHKNFDAIFLHVFPSFVDDFNSLLQPDQRFKMKDNSTLNTDLRIFALMHLGITDSTKIADFLHISLQTVYNSRLRTRSKTISRDNFDMDIRNLGRPIKYSEAPICFS